mmetsp:Transcript_21461/g.51170  ORF Transcript_21461/g.51170 Transcript_21461/m.51170 type:complete len:94 (+) Transcript_21461:688-969(+)
MEESFSAGIGDGFVVGKDLVLIEGRSVRNSFESSDGTIDGKREGFVAGPFEGVEEVYGPLLGVRIGIPLGLELRVVLYKLHVHPQLLKLMLKS